MTGRLLAVAPRVGARTERPWCARRCMRPFASGRRERHATDAPWNNVVIRVHASAELGEDGGGRSCQYLRDGSTGVAAGIQHV